MSKPPITEVIDTMYTMYADYPETELQYETPFQLLISVIMSAQTTDKQVNVVTDTLYKRVKVPQDIVDLGEEQLGEYIRFVGLRKAKKSNIYKTAVQLVANSEQRIANKTSGHAGTLNTVNCGDCHSEHSEEFHSIYGDSSIARSSLNLNDSGSIHYPGSLPSGQPFRASPQHMYTHCGYAIPDTISEITKLPGVGIKTAKVVLAVLYGQAWIAVDTHVHRVSKRLGRVRGKTITPETTSKRLEKKIPNDYKRKAHRSIIYFGRYHCTAKNPNCPDCPFKNRCPEGKRRLKDDPKHN